MTRPELSEERLSEAKGCAEALLKDWRCYPYADVRAAETTLALLDYVAELEGLARGIADLAEVVARISEPAMCGNDYFCEEAERLADAVASLRSTLPQPPAADKETP